MKKRSILLVIVSFISIIILSVNSNNKYLVKEESLATYIDGEKTDSFPAKGTVAFSKADCDNNTNIEWDNDNWGLYVTNLSNKVKCNIYFKTGENAVTKITSLASSDTTTMASDDPDNNIRYIGANPNNYVYFNCSDYANQTSDTCEKWRIIGLFNNIEKEDGTKENLIKIIRNDSIGQYSWNTSSDGNGYNDWTRAKLMQLLNPEYSLKKVNNSLYYYAKSGNCYNSGMLAYTSCDFTSTGLKKTSTRRAIETVIWNIGGNFASSGPNSLIASNSYQQERGTGVYEGHNTLWTGKIGLIYPSDYGYATSGGQIMNRDACLNVTMFNWANSGYEDCKNNNYLYNSEEIKWTMTADANSNNHLINIYNGGNVNRYDSLAYWYPSIYPTLYLKSNILIIGGDGSLNTPYQLGI